MSRKLPILIFSIIIFSRSFGQFVNKITDPVEWINPLMGTDSKPDMSNGNTYPTIALPWGMNFWSPQTGRMASILQGSSDTTFYVVAVYFGSVSIKNIRYSIGAMLLADLVGIITAIGLCYLFFG